MYKRGAAYLAKKSGMKSGEESTPTLHPQYSLNISNLYPKREE